MRKLLICSVLRKVLISRVFASEGESARKYSLIFWGRTENSDGKLLAQRVWEPPDDLLSAERRNACSESKLQALVETNSHRIYADPSLSAIVRIFGIHGISLYAYDVICVFVQIESMLHLLAIGCRIVHAYEIQLLSFGSVAVFYTVLEQS